MLGQADQKDWHPVKLSVNGAVGPLSEYPRMSKDELDTCQRDKGRVKEGLVKLCQHMIADPQAVFSWTYISSRPRGRNKKTYSGLAPRWFHGLVLNRQEIIVLVQRSEESLGNPCHADR